MACVTTTHLRENHGRNFDLPRLLNEAQTKDNRRRIKLALKQETEFCMHIRVARAPRLGRPAARRTIPHGTGASARLIWN